MSPSSKVAVNRRAQSANEQGCENSICTAALPYLELMRLDRPNGYWYFWYPHFFGTLLVAIEWHLRLQELIRINLVLLLGVLIMRGATCTWNDTVDVDFDRQTSRCCSRPIARGAVSIMQANMFTTIQALLSLATLVLLLPPLCTLYAIPAILGWCFYPLAKRVTYYPQVVLGFPMAWGVYMGAAAMGADPLHLGPTLNALTAHSGHLDHRLFLKALREVHVDRSYAAFYLANVLWTLLYEIVYSHQDATEDINTGVKNLVLLYANPAANPAERFGTLPLLVRLAVAQVLLLALAGVWAGFSAIYGTVCVVGSAVALTVMLSRVRLESPESCAWWFKVGNIRYTGGAIMMGLLIEYALGWTVNAGKIQR